MAHLRKSLILLINIFIFTILTIENVDSKTSKTFIDYDVEIMGKFSQEAANFGKESEGGGGDLTKFIAALLVDIQKSSGPTVPGKEAEMANTIWTKFGEITQKIEITKLQRFQLFFLYQQVKIYWQIYDELSHTGALLVNHEKIKTIFAETGAEILLINEQLDTLKKMSTVPLSTLVRMQNRLKKLSDKFNNVANQLESNEINMKSGVTSLKSWRSTLRGVTALQAGLAVYDVIDFAVNFGTGGSWYRGAFILLETGMTAIGGTQLYMTEARIKELASALDELEPLKGLSDVINCHMDYHSDYTLHLIEKVEGKSSTVPEFTCKSLKWDS